MKCQPPVLTSSKRFRHFIDGLLSLASFNLACRDHVPTFPQRSPPSLLTTAACGGLRPEPDCRSRRALLHLSYSCAPPFGPAMLVTHGESREGLSPPRAPKTVREPLNSHGFRCSAADIEDPPMGKERWSDATNPRQPLFCSPGTTAQTFELPSRPAD